MTMPRTATMLAIVSALFVLAWQPAAQADYSGFPATPKSRLSHVKLDEPALAPFAHTRFCLQYPGECQADQTADRSDLPLTSSRWLDLVDINRKINRAIRPERNLQGLAGERWLLHPTSGDCNDYAVTKRHELIKRGWPASALLLAEVIVPWGEHHLVLVVRTTSGDFVADNLHPNIRPWSATHYRWVRIQTPENSMLWARVANTTA